MRSKKWLALLMISSFFAESTLAAVAADGKGDVVNERPQVTYLEREAHWQVDCRASWAKLVESARTSPGGAKCRLEEAQRRALQLCSFIYQPPGEEPHSNCPNYREAISQLSSSCAQVQVWIRGSIASNGQCSY